MATDNRYEYIASVFEFAQSTRWAGDAVERICGKDGPAVLAGIRRADARHIAALNAARASGQGGEMREALARANDVLRSAYAIAERRGRDVSSWEGFLARIDAALKEQHVLLQSYWAEQSRARESSEPVLEEHDRWIDTDAIPPKPAEGREPEVDALLWMAEHLMGSSVAMTMRGWLAEYRATGKLVVRDADGTVKESLTVAAKERQ